MHSPLMMIAYLVIAASGVALFAIGFELFARFMERRRDTAHRARIARARRNRRRHAPEHWANVTYSPPAELNGSRVSG